jgi:hypothetical protein
VGEHILVVPDVVHDRPDAASGGMLAIAGKAAVGNGLKPSPACQRTGRLPFVVGHGLGVCFSAYNIGHMWYICLADEELLDTVCGINSVPFDEILKHNTLVVRALFHDTQHRVEFFVWSGSGLGLGWWDA